MKKVSADTITELSAAAHFPQGNPGTPPTSQQMIRTVESSLEKKIQNLRKHVEESRQNVTPETEKLLTAYEISLKRAIENLKKFREIIKDPPAGFELVPVYYSRITIQQANSVEKEYSSRVRLHFVKYLANNHANELRALGICQRGIDRMKEGLSPIDEKGKIYRLNVDHIIERSGSGLLGEQKEIDPLLPAGSSPTYKVNHINNFILLPEKIHELKNTLNGMQHASNTARGEGRWILMLVPKNIPGRSGLVALPQKPDHPMAGLDVRAYTLNDRFTDIAFTADRANDALYFFEHNEIMSPLIYDAKKTAEQEANTVLRMAMDEKMAGKDKLPSSLTYTFNHAVSRNPSVQEFVETTLKPAFDSVLEQIDIAMRDADTYGNTENNYRLFEEFYLKSNSLSQMRHKIAGLALDETIEAQKSLLNVRRKLKSKAHPTAAK